MGNGDEVSSKEDIERLSSYRVGIQNSCSEAFRLAQECFEMARILKETKPKMFERKQGFQIWEERIKGIEDEVVERTRKMVVEAAGEAKKLCHEFLLNEQPLARFLLVREYLELGVELCQRCTSFESGDEENLQCGMIDSLSRLNVNQ